MEDSQFHEAFKDLFEDEDELDEAVYFLNLQGGWTSTDWHGYIKLAGFLAIHADSDNANSAISI